MAQDPQGTYTSVQLEYIRVNAGRINEIASILGVSSTGLAGSLAEEINDSVSAPKWKQVGDFMLDFAVRLGTASHDQIQVDYQAVYAADFPIGLRKDPGFSGKAWHPTLRNLGMGNIKLLTAIDLLYNYDLQNPLSDPLDIKRYLSDFESLAGDLANPASDASIKFAGLMVKEASDFFQYAAPGTWSTSTVDYRDGLIVTYYNLGREQIWEKYRERQDNYVPLVGDGGLDHLNNADVVRSVFQEGLANPPTEEAVEDYYSRLYEELYGSYFPGTYTRVEGYSYVIGSIDTIDAEDWLNYEMVISGGVVASESILFDDGTTVSRASDPGSDPTDPASWQTTVTPAPADEPPVLLHPEPQIISGYQIGQAFGSALGQLIGGSNTFARVAAGSALGVVLGNVGETCRSTSTTPGSRAPRRRRTSP